MANLCENTLVINSNSQKNINYITDFIKTNFECNSLEYVNDNCIKIEFNSKWMFPVFEMDQMFQNLPNKEDIQMDCLSVEWGCYYCEFRSCDSMGWKIEN